MHHNKQLVELVSKKPTAKVMAATGAATGTAALSNAVILLLSHFFGVSAPVAGALAVVGTTGLTFLGTYLGGYMKRNNAEDVIVQTQTSHNG